MAVDWDEISDAALGIFSIWTSGGDLVFAKECWSHLAADGLTSDDSDFEVTQTSLRLVALRLVYGEFCAVKWDQEFDTPISYLVEDLEIDPLALGLMAAESLEPGSELLEAFSLRAAALEAAIEPLKPEIFMCLLKAYGGPVGLYSRLSRSNNYPDDDDDKSGSTVSGDLAALDFVRNYRTS